MKKWYVALFVLSCLTCAVLAEDDDASSEQLPPPEKNEMRMNDLKASLVDMDGKIVETTINHVMYFEQMKNGKYSASCGYYAGGEVITSQTVLIPEEGKEFFQGLAKKSGSGLINTQRVYLRVNGKRLEAVGTRYSKSKGEYSW